MINKTNKKIFGSIDADTHQKINLIKIQEGFKNINDTIKYLISLYIKSSNLKEIENIKSNKIDTELNIKNIDNGN